MCTLFMVLKLVIKIKELTDSLKAAGHIYHNLHIILVPNLFIRIDIKGVWLPVCPLFYK